MAPSIRSVLLIALTTCLFALADHWNRPNDRSLDGIDGKAYFCDQSCEDVLSQAIEADRTSIFGQIPFDDDFYATPSNFSPENSKAGDLLKVEKYINTVAYTTIGVWDIPGGTNLYRIQYVSVGANDRRVPATAFIALPFSKPEGKGFATVAYAHGTIGTFYGCASSTTSKLFDSDTWRPLLLAGYAVITTDYAGLGNNYTRHHWLANKLNANDVYYSVVAAKQAFPTWLGDKWAALGNSQGGGAVWALTESDLVASDPSFLGAVAIEPGVRFADLITSLVEDGSDDTKDFAPLSSYTCFLYAVLEALKEGSASSLFTLAMVARNRLETELGLCKKGESALATQLGVNQIFSNVSAVASNPGIQLWHEKYAAGVGRKAQAPMLVVQSTASRTIPNQLIEKAWRTTCSAGGHSVRLSLYSSLDHSAIIGASAPEWLQWTHDRFAGVSPPDNCQNGYREALDEDAAYLPLDFEPLNNFATPVVAEQSLLFTEQYLR